MAARILGFFFLMLMAGCAVNRAVIDPFAYSPEQSCWYWTADSRGNELACAEPTQECVDLPCENYPLSLGEVLDIALLNNPETQISWANARQAAAQYGQSQSTFFPNISFQYPLTSTRTAFLASQVELTTVNNNAPEGLIESNQTTWGPQAYLTWTLLDFGQRKYTSEAARYALYYSNFTHNEILQQTIEQTTLDYYNYLYQKKLLEANEADLATAEETLAAAELGLKTGVKNVSDVLQARTQALLAEITLSEQYGAVNTAYATLLDTMGLPANATISLDKLPFVDPESTDLESLENFIEIAMHCRPDLLASRANLTSTEMSLKAAKRQWVPVLDYSLQIGRTNFSGGFRDDYDYTSTLAVNLPIFTGFNIKNSVRAARAAVEAACASLKQTELGVISDITQAHYNVTVAFNTLKAAIKYFEAAREEYDVAISQYRMGVNTILDVVSAQSSLFDARAKQADAVREWFSSIATLTYSAGIMGMNIEDCQ